MKDGKNLWKKTIPFFFGDGIGDGAETVKGVQQGFHAPSIAVILKDVIWVALVCQQLKSSI